MVIDDDFRKKAIAIANDQIRELRKKHPRRNSTASRTTEATKPPVSRNLPLVPGGVKGDATKA